MFSVNEYKLLGQRIKQNNEVIDYGVQMVGAPLEWSETMGENVRVGIIDTGIDLNHEDLRDNIKKYANFTSDDINDIKDENGHGTHVAGIIAAEQNGIGVVGVAPKAELYIAKAFGKDGTASGESIAKSLRWLIDNDVNVINMSFSASAASDDYTALIKEAYQKGIIMVCAAGNEGGSEDGADTIGYPAKFPETIAVTSVDINKNRSSFSSVGVEARVAAAGTNIYSTYMGNSYATLSGTSMATPIITGAVAILHGKCLKRYNRYLTPNEVLLLLDIYAEDLGQVGRDSAYGYGVFTFGRFNQNENLQYHTSKIRKFLNSNSLFDLLIGALAFLL